MKQRKVSTDSDPRLRLQRLNEYLQRNFPDFFAEARFQVGDDDYFLYARFGQYLARIIEQTLAVFEPRLKKVKVAQLESTSGAQHVLRFQIEGLLDMDPAPELISFDTVLQLSSGEYQVKGDTSAG